ncbi:MAG: AMP-binding protein, partial [Rhodospirillales bacterium]
SALRPLGPDEPCYVQYSSGSTRQPRGVLITQRSLVHNARAIARHGLALRPGDCGTSWLPLYHDMGLVGFCLTPMLSQIPVHYLSPTAFARRPLVWLKILSEYGGTISFSPTAGYELCVRSASSGANRGFDLRHWRIAGVGGDMLRADVLDRFAERFASHGFSPSAFVPSYGLAEATLAVSFGPLGAGVRWDVVRLDALESSGYAAPALAADSLSAEKIRPFAICGRPLPSHDIAIRDDNGATLPDRQVGRVWIKGPSVMGSYFDDPAVLSAAPRSGHWFDTGDLGYSRAGELVIAGRSKDLIIWNGRNIWPQDLEWAVGEVQGIRSGAVAAFAVDGGTRGDEIVVIAECRSRDARSWSELRRTITMTLHRTAGVVCRLVLVAPHSLPFTSSGKLSRAAAQALYLQGAIKDVADGSSMA